MNTCATCKHWSEQEYGGGLYTFSRASTQRRCLKIVHVDEHAPSRVNEQPAFVVDYEGYDSDLYTLPDFGCVLWEER